MGVHELAREPSPENWRLLCEALDRMAEPEALSVIDEITPVLDKWPDELRATMCGMTWDDQFFDGEPNPRSKIVRYFRFDRYFSGRYGGGLRMRDRRIDGATMRRMCDSPALAGLTQLNLSYQLGVDGVVQIADCPHFRNLKKLDLGGFEVGTSDVLEQLAAAEFYTRLTELSLAGCSISGDQVGQLFRDDGGPEYLDLSINPLGVDGARVIAERLRSAPKQLGLGSCELGDEGASALAQISQPLERLMLNGNGITDEGVRGLAGGTLRAADVEITGSLITSTGVTALVAWPLTKLNLTDNALDDAAARVLAERAPTTLVELWLGDNDITARGLAALLGSSRLAGLEELHLGTNRIGAFADVEITLGNLETLDLEHNRLGDGIRALAGISSEKLTKLDLAHNAIGIRALEELTGATWFSRLLHLDLSDNPLGPGAGVVFGAWPIENLNLSRTELGDSGATTLFAAGLRPKQLSLANCGLTDAAISALVSSPTCERIEILTLDDNAITETGVRALLDAKPPRLTQLKLRNNRLDDESVVELAQWAQLLHVELEGNEIGKRGKAALDARPSRCCP